MAVALPQTPLEELKGPIPGGERACCPRSKSHHRSQPLDIKLRPLVPHNWGFLSYCWTRAPHSLTIPLHCW